MNKKLLNLSLVVMAWVGGQSMATSFGLAGGYPEEALAECIEGDVVVKLVVSDDGAPVDIEVIEATPEGVFEEATLKFLPYWRFDDEPGTEKEQTIEWRIEDKEHCNS